MGAWGAGIWHSDTALDAKTAFYRGQFGECSDEAELLQNVQERFGSAGVLAIAKIFVEVSDAYRLKGEAAQQIEKAVEDELENLDQWVDPDKRWSALRGFTQDLNDGMGNGESINPVHGDALLD